MSDKHNIEIDLNDVRGVVQDFFKDKVVAILESSCDLVALKTKADQALKGEFFKDPTIIKTIVDQCEWSLGAAIREALEGSKFKDHVAAITSDLMSDEGFNSELKERIKESLLKRL